MVPINNAGMMPEIKNKPKPIAVKYEHMVTIDKLSPTASQKKKRKNNNKNSPINL